MQWILQDIPLGRNIQTVRMSRNMTQMQVVEKMQLIGSSIRLFLTSDNFNIYVAYTQEKVSE